MRRVAAIAVLAALTACGNAERERGLALFAGDVPIVARIGGQEEALPSSASRCTNCHGIVRASSPASGATFAPALSARFLREARSRRGGPASRFNEATPCRRLR